MAVDRGNWNQKVIEEYRANGGQVGGPFAGAPLLLLHHRGAKTGAERVSPVMYQRVEDGYAVFASKGGAPSNPAWYHNLTAHPETEVELGTEVIPVRARQARGAERDRIWEKQKREYPNFAEYEEKTSRQIPVLVLEPRN